MAGNSFGSIFRITTFGESHGPMIGVVIDGCPAGLYIDKDFIQTELDRRKPGQSGITTKRKEEDAVEIVSGVYENKSTGSPITMLIKNKDQVSKDYDKYKDVYRPSHADYTYEMKYGIRDHRGGGRASARETAARVAAGALAKLLLNQYGIQINAFVSQVGEIELKEDYKDLDFNEIERNVVRCPSSKTALKMIAYIEELAKAGDSAGGKISCVVRNAPVGLGEPVFDRLEADLAKAMLSINASKAFEIGTGFGAAGMLGSRHNDPMKIEDGKLVFETNNAGGVLGGISNGEDIYFNVAFKPTSTIKITSEVLSKSGETIRLGEKKGRHDPCIVPRAVPIVEAMTALVLADHLLRQRAVKS